MLNYQRVILAKCPKFHPCPAPGVGGSARDPWKAAGAIGGDDQGCWGRTVAGGWMIRIPN